MLRVLFLLVALLAAVATASPVFAMAGGGGRRGGGGSGSTSHNITRGEDWKKDGTFEWNSGGSGGNGGTSPGTHKVGVTEPLVGVFVGLGLLGARYLRGR